MISKREAIQLRKQAKHWTSKQFSALLMHLIRKEKVREFKAAVRAYAYWNVSFFAKYFLPHYCPLPFSQMHFDLLRKNPLVRGSVKVIAAPRGHAKTTIWCLIDSIHDICYGLEDFILIISETSSVGDDRVRDIRGELEGNDLIMEYFGDLVGEKWTETDIATSNGIRVTSKGRGKQVRGLVRKAHRPSKIVVDDVESKESVRNPAQREKAWNWLMQDVMRVGRIDGTSNFRFIGTFLHQEAALPRLAKIPAYQAKVYKAVLSWSKRPDLWDEWRTIYADLDDDSREQNALEFFKMHESEMMDGVKMLWPEGITYYQVQEAIINTGRYAVNSELQNEPHDPETQIFDMKNAKRFMVFEANGEKILKTEAGNKPIAGMRKALFLDPALGSDSGVSYPCIAVLAKDGKGYAYVLDIWLDKVPPSRQVVQAFEMAQKWGVNAIGLETNLFKDYMENDFKAERDRRRRKGEFWQVDIKPIHQSRNKEDRISVLEPKVANGWLLFNQVLSEEAFRSFEQFPTAAIDDPPDAVEGAYSLLARSGIQLKRMPRGGARTRL